MFCVLRTESIPEHLHGYISRYLTAVRSGLYVGSLSSRSIDRLWKAILLNIENGDVVLITPAKGEQNFVVRNTENNRWGLCDYDGITLPYTRSL